MKFLGTISDNKDLITKEALESALIPTIYTTTTPTTEAWYRIATIPSSSQYKGVIFRVKAYTATGTTSESIITINLAYYSGNYSSQYSAITANNSHSYYSVTNAENGIVLLYCRVSFDANYGYIDIYKYKTTTVTIETQPLTTNDWIWATGLLAANPTVGTYRNTQVTLYYGLTGNNIQASSASYSTYSSYGVLGTQTLTDNTTKTGLWSYFGYITLDYNSSYLQSRTVNVRCRLQEVSPNGEESIDELDDFSLNITTFLGYHANNTAFNAAIPNIALEIDGKTDLTTTDICGLVYSTNTSNKVIRFYIKLKNTSTVYLINPEQRYGRAFTTSYGNTTSYANFNYVTGSSLISELPTPAQSSIIYATFREVNASTLNGLSSTDFAAASHIGATGAAHGVATTSVNGFMSSTDKTILNNATNANTANTLVKRDASGNFSAGTITASLSGNASTAAALQTARTINGVSFNGASNITIYDSSKLPLTGGTLSGPLIVNDTITTSDAYYFGTSAYIEFNATTESLDFNII